MFLAWTPILISLESSAWNPDYAYGLPKQLRMCVKRETADTVLFSSISADASCPPETSRYVVVFGREPRGSIGLISTSTSQKFYPPLTLSWPTQASEFSGSPLWHFTCIKPHSITLLETTIEMLSYKGEITSTGKKNCLEAQERALDYCRKEWQGEGLLENCPVGWGIE